MIPAPPDSARFEPNILVLNWTPALPADQQRGLLGYLRLCFDGLVEVDGVTLRRTLDGRRTLSFPSRTDRWGQDHPVLRPKNGAVRAMIERRVLAALAQWQEVQP